MNPLDIVLKILGSQSALAKKLGVKPAVINHWRTRGVPPDMAFEISDAVDGAVPARAFVEDWRRRKATTST